MKILIEKSDYIEVVGIQCMNLALYKRIYEWSARQDKPNNYRFPKVWLIDKSDEEGKVLRARTKDCASVDPSEQGNVVPVLQVKFNREQKSKTISFGGMTWWVMGNYAFPKKRAELAGQNQETGKRQY